MKSSQLPPVRDFFNPGSSKRQYAVTRTGDERGFVIRTGILMHVFINLPAEEDALPGEVYLTTVVDNSGRQNKPRRTN